MKKVRFLSIVSAGVAVLAFGVLAVGAGEGDQKKDEGKTEAKVALADVPAVVKEAAQKAVPGIVLTEAEKQTKGAEVVYELDGKVGDKEYELKITAEGKVLKTKVEDAGDDDAGKGSKDKKAGDDKKGGKKDDKKAGADKDEADGDNNDNDNDDDGENENDD
jgi:hypothetical protein